MQGSPGDRYKDESRLLDSLGAAAASNACMKGTDAKCENSTAPTKSWVAVQELH